MRIRLYLDEDSARHALARELRIRGADVVTALEASMSGATDQDQLGWAAAHGRAIYSYNRSDFYRLHTDWLSAGRIHSGVILCRQDFPLGEQMRRLLSLINRVSSEEFANRVVFLSSTSGIG